MVQIRRKEQRIPHDDVRARVVDGAVVAHGSRFSSEVPPDCFNRSSIWTQYGLDPGDIGAPNKQDESNIRSD